MSVLHWSIFCLKINNYDAEYVREREIEEEWKSVVFAGRRQKGQMVTVVVVVVSWCLPDFVTGDEYVRERNRGRGEVGGVRWSETEGADGDSCEVVSGGAGVVVVCDGENTTQRFKEQEMTL
ncbi:hypothetical protein L1987_02382 [Smallanthus sonchifolius]|uniref:Uncharacterized protein n=1 Tax=Smallanthus sonchifolius TaxID=185202 RepID=A0ACB9K7M5_9ASTR|nr:hypothetical protein L1987_02382 [Smallanthus sonchifolius]